jgi:ABC-type multidrug transport system fused ATPase/permease subunit
LLITVGIILAIHAYFSNYQQKFFKELLPVNRKYGYYIGLTFDKNIHKDARIYGMGGILGDTIKDYNIEINRWFSKFYRRMGLCLGLFQVVTVLQTAFAYGYVGARTLGGVSIGDLTMYVASAIGFSTAVIELGSAIVNIFQMLGYLEPFAELMGVPDESSLSGSSKLGRVNSVSFEHVSFTYPKTDKKILDDISFEIEEGEKISIVGLNGAGKSTVVKLLCRLYSPDSGRILINGYDIREYDRASYLAGIAAVFQDFKLFNFTVSENITCRPAGTDKEKTRQIIGEVGLTEKIDSLPYGLDTLFGKEYDNDGVEFSGGQAQKIAIARALYKDASLVILDEPTSALDPLAEAEIYENFNRMVGSKTAIYISHRMSSSVFCDRVMVISGGKIEAFDTHRKLMENKEGTYFRLFSSQAENYRLA